MELLLYAATLITCQQGYRVIFPDKGAKPMSDIVVSAPKSPNASFTASGGGQNIINVTVNTSSSNTNIVPAPTFTEQFKQQVFGDVTLGEITEKIGTYCSNHKYSLAALTIASSYAYLMYKIHVIKAHISNAQNWSAWKQDIPLENLLSIPQEQLTQELIAAIQSHYTNPQNPTDFLTPIINFTKDVSQELELLTQYHSFISWNMQFSLQKIVPFSDSMLTQLTERKQRITYLRTLFNGWLAHYKLDQITGSHRSVRKIRSLKPIDDASEKTPLNMKVS